VKYIVNIFKGLFKHYLSLFLSIGKDTILVRALAKNGSFGFAEGSACGRGKTKCAICAVVITHVIFVYKGVREYSVFQNILCGGKKIKTQKGRQ